MGLSFERVCMMHTDQIKQKLGISGVLTDINSWYCKPDPDKGVFGSQIDMLLTGTKYAIYPTLITTYGLVPNSYSECVQSVVTLKDLFVENL